MRKITFLIAAALTKLNAAEYLNLMTRLREQIEKATPEALGLTLEEFNEFKALVDKLQDRISFSSASRLTQTLKLLESQRDNVISSLFATIQAAMKLTIQTKADAAIALERLIRPYANIQRLPDQQETVKIYGLEKDLSGEEAQANLTTLGLTDVYEEMIRLNDEFAALTAQRTSEKDLQGLETVAELRKMLDPMYVAVTGIAEAESIANPTETTAEFIRVMNAIIREVNRLYNLRVGHIQKEEQDPTVPGTDPVEPDGEEPTEPNDPDDGDEGSGTPGKI